MLAAPILAGIFFTLLILGSALSLLIGLLIRKRAGSGSPGVRLIIVCATLLFSLGILIAGFWQLGQLTALTPTLQFASVLCVGLLISGQLGALMYLFFGEAMLRWYKN